MKSLSKIRYLKLATLLLLAFLYSTPTTGNAQIINFRIPIWLSDSLMVLDPPLEFGFHPHATECLDDSLGEFFIWTECSPAHGHCNYFQRPLFSLCDAEDFPVWLDLRKSRSSSQIDTFWIKYLGTPPVVLHWPKTIGTFFDSCRVFDGSAFEFPQLPQKLNIDMLSIDSAVISINPSYDSWGIIIRTVGPKMPTSVRESIHSTPESWMLSANYPNPFNPRTTFQLSLSKRAQVSAKVFDVLGRHISTVISSPLEAGDHEISWDGNDFNGFPAQSGIYFLRLTAVSDDVSINSTTTRKLILLK